MKKLALVALSVSFLICCNKVGENEYIISGDAKGIKDGKKVFLEKILEGGMGTQAIDTVVVKGGKFEIKGNTNEPAIHLIQIEEVNGKVQFILEEGEIAIKVDKDSIQKSTKGGTFNNDVLQKFEGKFNELSKSVQKEVIAFQQKNMSKMQEAQQKNDTVTVNALTKEYKTIIKKMTDEYVSFAEQNPKAFISVLIAENMSKQRDTDAKQLQKIYDAFPEELKKTKPGKAIQENLKLLLTPKVSTEVGAVAPDFTAPDVNGKPVSLKQSLGKVTIIDFWASWCGPCRKENPSVVALYNEFKSKGLAIIGVSLDRSGKADEWKKAIQDDKLTWTQVSNLKFWDEPVAKLYGVESIPATFILDASGKIVAKDLRGDALRAKVAELLK